MAFLGAFEMTKLQAQERTNRNHIMVTHGHMSRCFQPTCEGVKKSGKEGFKKDTTPIYSVSQHFASLN
jgi:hypothetical protein